MLWLDSRDIKTERSCKKFDYTKLGPFRISEQVSPVAYRLILPERMGRVHNVIHVSKLEKCSLESPAQSVALHVIEEQSSSYRLKRILDSRCVG